MIELPRVMGHRGAAASAPENTLISLRTASEQGARWVEFDVMLSGDGVPVLIHDENLRRTTGHNALVANTPVAELRRLDAGSWFGPAFADARIPTLEEALALLVELGVSPNLEIKPSTGADEPTAIAAMRVLAEHWPHDRMPALVSSFSRLSLRAAQRESPQFPRGLLITRPPRDWAEVAKELACSTVHIDGRRVTPQHVERIKGAGYGLAVYTVNDPIDARHLLAAGVDCIITDAPGAMIKALG
jgi:glycerophosphoryl diester phosphodiesterase